MNAFDELRFKEVREKIHTLIDWDKFIDAVKKVERGDETAAKELDELVKELIAAIDRTNFTYKKHTYEMREDLLPRIKEYCVRHDISQKVFINAAAEVFLRLNERRV